MEAQYIYGCSVSIFFYLADKNDYEIDTDSDKKSTVVQKWHWDACLEWIALG